MLRPFATRVRASRARFMLAFGAPRWRLAIAIASVPALTLFALVVAPSPLSDALVEPQRARDAYARYISGLITAATMAVGFAALAMRRGIKGLGELTDSVRADAEFADRVRDFTRQPDAGAVGPLVADILDEVAARADTTRAEGEAAAFLASLGTHAREVAAQIRRARDDPDALLRAALDFEGETAIHLARIHGMREIEDGVRLADIGRAYLKTLATQWGLSRMSQGIAVTSLVAVSVATFMVMGYGDLAPRALAAGLLGGSLFVLTLPLAVFVSFVARFIFLHQHTLPLGHFVFGPENPGAFGHPHQR